MTQHYLEKTPFLSCSECGSVLRPVRASNARHQRRGGKRIRIDLWVCGDKELHGTTRPPVEYGGALLAIRP